MHWLLVTFYISFMDMNVDFTRKHDLINRELSIHYAFAELFGFFFS